MAQDIGTGHGIKLIIIQDQSPGDLEFIIIHGQDGDSALGLVMVGSHLVGILIQGAGGGHVDIDMATDMATIGDIVMDTDMDIDMDIMQEEELAT